MWHARYTRHGYADGVIHLLYAHDDVEIGPITLCSPLRPVPNVVAASPRTVTCLECLGRAIALGQRYVEQRT